MIAVPELGDEFHAMWLELFDLARASSVQWTLIGAHMGALHGWNVGVSQVRASRDADVLVNARAMTDGTEVLSRMLREREFEFAGASPDGVGHRFVKSQVSIDVLAPDGMGPRNALLTVGGAHTVQVPGGTQALHRSAPIKVSSRRESGEIPLPSLLGAILVKVRAIEVDDEPNAQREDVAFLLGLVDDPDPMVTELSSSERGWLRRYKDFGDPMSECYRRIENAREAAIVYRRLAE